jgi:hypothetical protein
MVQYKCKVCKERIDIQDLHQEPIKDRQGNVKLQPNGQPQTHKYHEECHQKIVDGHKLQEYFEKFFDYGVPDILYCMSAKLSSKGVLKQFGYNDGNISIAKQLKNLKKLGNRFIKKAKKIENCQERADFIMMNICGIGWWNRLVIKQEQRKALIDYNKYMDEQWELQNPEVYNMGR